MQITNTELFAMLATTFLGSPLILALLKALYKWVSGKVEQKALLEQKVIRLNQTIRSLEERIARLRIFIVNKGHDPNDIDPLGSGNSQRK